MQAAPFVSKSEPAVYTTTTKGASMISRMWPRLMSQAVMTDGVLWVEIHGPAVDSFYPAVKQRTVRTLKILTIQK